MNSCRGSPCAANSRGLPGIAFDLGTKRGWCPWCCPRASRYPPAECVLQRSGVADPAKQRLDDELGCLVIYWARDRRRSACCSATARPSIESRGRTRRGEWTPRRRWWSHRRRRACRCQHPSAVHREAFHRSRFSGASTRPDRPGSGLRPGTISVFHVPATRILLDFPSGASTVSPMP